MTWITDDTGTRWVEPEPRKRRKAPRVIRFADIKVGDQLMRKPREGSYIKRVIYYIVTDLWFDPVAGQDDPIKGQMVGYQQIGDDGAPRHRKTSTPIRGLASQQFEYADVDYVALCKARLEAMKSGQVVGIGYGRAVRARPKLSGL